MLPGGIDPHTHFDLDIGITKTADDFYSGTRAAILGGTTTILDYATQNKGETLCKAFEKQVKKSKDVCFCDYGFHMGMTDWNEITSIEMNEMIKKGVTSFKLYMAYKNKLQVNDGIIYQALKRSKEVKGLIAFHCENGDVIDVLVKEALKNNHNAPIYHALTRPNILEEEAITRLLYLAKMTDACVYVVHLSTREGLLKLVDAKKQGIKVHVETCPQYLLLNEQSYDYEGEKYVMSPPLRKAQDNEALWNGLKIGDIETIGTDHCSFNYIGQKNMGDNFSMIPNGAPGVEHRMALLYTYGVLDSKLSFNQMVALTSTNAAKIFGLYPQKGTIMENCDADLVVLDPQHKSKIKASMQSQNVDYTPYENFERQGLMRYVFLRGRKVVENERLIDDKPLGKYLHRKPYSGGM